MEKSMNYSIKWDSCMLKIYNGKTGGFLRSISCSGIKSVTLSGDVIGVLKEDNKIYNYDASTGRYLSTIQ